MKSLWSDADAERMVDAYAAADVGRDVALRVYSTRLLGGVADLVLHGGGNTSVKTSETDLNGDLARVIRVKGSGWNMATIEPPGLPAVRLEPLLRLQTRETLSDEDMVNIQRANLLDFRSPNPSVETLLHAFLPHTFIDHTHSVAVLAVTNLPDGAERAMSVFGDRVAYVPYVMPGFALAKRTAEIWEANPDCDALILLKHGIFTMGATARDAYERMIELVSRAEAAVAGGTGRSLPPVVQTPPASSADLAPIIRGALALPEGDGQFRRWILEFRTGPNILRFVNGAEVHRYARAGVVTPDHIIRTKDQPLVLPAPPTDNLDGFAATVRAAVADYHDAYRQYFDRHNARFTPPKVPLDPAPRIILVPGYGFFAAGPTARDAQVTADVYETAITSILWAENLGSFESIAEADRFDMEYWSLEQAKLGKAVIKPLLRHVVFVTGGAGTIGRATVAAFLEEGAEVAFLDRDEARVVETVREMGPRVLGIPGDVTDPNQVAAAFNRICEQFGGVDVVVSNAGAAWEGRIGDLPDETLRRSFELNFFAHQCVAQHAVRVMRRQGTGGALLFNVSKQAVNPGEGFGAYGLPKAAALFLMRQYALDHGKEGIRANGVNADRIRSNLLTAALVASRARSRGIDEEAYFKDNLLRREVAAADVAQAFVHLALANKTTAGVTTVDGGNIAAALR